MCSSWLTRWLAPIRFSPAPPARVDSRKTCPTLRVLKLSTMDCRSSTLVPPSIRTLRQLQHNRRHSRCTSRSLGPA